MKNEKSINELKQMLGSATVNVTFTKKDGSLRVMKCTAAGQLIPEDKKSQSTARSTKNEDICVVYDLEKEDWRSFRLDSIISFDNA